jgi:hypothetical protein
LERQKLFRQSGLETALKVRTEIEIPRDVFELLEQSGTTIAISIGRTGESGHSETSLLLGREKIELLIKPVGDVDLIADLRGLHQEIKVCHDDKIEWARHLSPKAKRDVLRALVPELDELDALVDYGNQRMRQLCAERGIDWDSLAEERRQRLIDELLHET